MSTLYVRTGEIHPIDALKNVRRENRHDVPLVHQRWPALFCQRASLERTRWLCIAYYQWSMESVAPSQQSSSAWPMQSGFDNICGGSLDDAWEVDRDEKSTVASGPWKDPRSKFDRHHHLQLEWDELDILSAQNDLLDWIMVRVRSSGQLFTTCRVM